MLFDPSQTVEFPLIKPGCGGKRFTETLFVLIGLEPQELLAVTEIKPPVLPAVVLMIFDDELPLQPFGNIHV